MHLILLYGAPAVGKLTVAQHLAQKLDYKILHNHLTIDLITELFSRSNPRYWKLTRSIRLELFKAAAEEGLKGVIFTYGYIHPTAHLFINDLIALSKEQDITLCFVYLTCSLEELIKRVEEPSRKGTGKLQTKEMLLPILPYFKKIPFVDNLEIDNTDLSPDPVADIIINHFKIPAHRQKDLL